jgi:hypothetical protein
MANDNEVTQTSNSETIDVEACVALYVELRDEIAALKAELTEKLKPYQKGLADLDGILLKHLQDQKAQNVKTRSGTVSQRISRSATIRDKLAFREFVVTNGEYDLVDWRANKVQVFDWIEKNQLEIPGVNTSAFMTIGVRRDDKASQEEC